ncbi:MAG: metallopeptidase [Chloroflexi bacterium]|nr:metallopeptidase [Chloroflexota bacterium]
MTVRLARFFAALGCVTIALAVPLPVAAEGGIVPGAVNRASLAVEARYEVRLALSMATYRLSAAETIEIVNRSGSPIDRLDLNTVLARLGGLQITAASVDGQPVTPSISDQTIRLPLGGVLPDGAGATIRLSFRARFGTRLDGSRWLFTAAGGTFAAYRWLPWISAARPFDRPNHGDPFVTASSPSVRLTVTCDRVTRISTNLRRTSVSADRKTQVFEGSNVRDLNLVADTRFSVASRWVGDTQVHVFARTAAARSLLLGQAARSLARLEALLGPYPWPTLSVAQTAGGFGVESPGAIWIPRGVSGGNLSWLVAHEIAHQWFYGLTGNDQARQPFADEAPGDFLARYVTGSFRASRCATARLDRSIYAYSAGCYFEIVYVQGGRLLLDVRKRVGSTAFFRALRSYLDAHRFGLGSTRELIASLDEADPRDLARLWEPRFPSLLP